ncbi:MAG: polyprenyl synthetase family protein [Candidatus Aminicenantes bacterium]|nr:polyprenyl synthetase family protein [Candidatus Aminicenantes bacterium]
MLAERPDLSGLYNHIRDELDRVEESLKMLSSSANPLIAEISRYLFQKKGKRIRPALLILCSKLLRYRGDDHIFMAALIEFIHTASLIHDDIIDNADRRRGRDSVHTRWGPNISVLLGDYLYIKSIGLSLESDYPGVVRILTDVSSRMIDGELTEYSLSGHLDTAEPDYLEVINKKTASLFAAACQIGAVLGEATPEQERLLVDYGRNLGLTFQMIDDLLDFQGDEDELGKPVLSDLSEGRITLPLIYALRTGRPANRRRLQALMRKKAQSRESRKEILEIIRGNGALDYTYRKAEGFSLRARGLVSLFPDSAHREALSLLAEFVLIRSR